MKITAKAPCRVDMAGGTIDIWPLYLFHAAPVTVNFAVDRYASCVLETRADARITLRSRDLDGHEEFESLAALRAAKRYKLPLAAYMVRYFAPATGLDLVTDSEAPAGAGISGSSTLIIALAAAFNKLTQAGHKLEKLREIAQNIEAQIIRVPTGCQDYYPAMYGGVSAIELTEAGIVRKPRGGGSGRSERTRGAGLYRRAAQFRHQQLGSHEGATSTATAPCTAISTASRRSRAPCGRRWRSPIGTKWRGCCGRSGPTARRTRPGSRRR